MKIFVIYDHASAPASAHHKLAITLPAKWLELSVDKVKAAFVAAYNKKFADAPLDGDSFALQVRDDSPFTHSDVRTLRTVDVPAKALSDRCEAACRHHRLPPMFHDTRKWWTCCADIKVYSFDELMEVPGCAIGHHSADPPPQEVERQRAMAEATARVHAAHLEGAKKFYQAPKPDAAGNAPPPDHGAAAAPPAAPPPRKRPPLPEGRARCRHPGCNAEYSVAENHSTACRYHLKPPLFHEGSKQWQCCGVKKWDFDDFLAVPGCAVGPHEPDE